MDKYIGKVLDNRYEILEIIGVGGMAVVYKARDRVLDRYVAIKILKDEFVHDEEFRKRFANESHAVAQLSHNNIVSVYDVSRSENPQYIVMELIEGITLKEYLTKKGALTWQETLFFTQQIAKALEHAHSRGIIHQDIKPHNICLLRDGTVKVMDFGIARFEKNQETRVIQEAIGSVHYISPEQAKGSAIDHRADLYSLGVMMYEMLTGHVPFDGDTPLAIVMQHINAVPLAPSEVVPGIPKGMDDIVMRAMCPTLNKRYASASEVYNDLEKLKRQPNIRFENTPTRQSGVDGETVVLPNFNQERKREQEIRREPERRPIRTPVYEPDDEDDDDEEEFRSRPRKRSIFGRLVESPLAMGALGVLLCVVIAAVAAVKLFGMGGELIVVPRFIGSNIAEIINDEQYTAQFTFEMAAEPVIDNDKDEGTIVDQSPAPGENAKQGSKIVLTVTKHDGSQPSEPEGYELEDLAGKNVQAARLLLENRGIRCRVEAQPDLEVAKDTVISTDPVAGTMLAEGDEVIVYVSAGPEGIPVEVPDLIGRGLSEAQQMLRDRKLEVEVKARNDDAPSNQVIAQSYDPETMVDAGTVVTITISLGPETPIEPEPPEDDPDEEPGYAQIYFDLDPDEPHNHVKIEIEDGSMLFENTYDTASSSEEQSATVEAPAGMHTVYVFVNGELVDTRDVHFG